MNYMGNEGKLVLAVKPGSGFEVHFVDQYNNRNIVAGSHDLESVLTRAAYNLGMDLEIPLEVSR